MIELDVRLSRDRELVVIHDQDLSRTTDGKGQVSEMTLAQLRQLDAGSSFSEEFAGEQIPTLTEALSLVKGLMLLNVEIKTDADTGELVTEKALRLIHEMQIADQVIISSFDPSVLKHSRDIDPGVKTASLYNELFHMGQSPIEIMEQVGSVAYNLRDDQVTVDIIAECHEHGRPVAIYTINDLARIPALVQMGIDAIFTDRPDVMLELLKV
jgi:glycerophosphoryl diester phosphodiesterase